MHGLYWADSQTDRQYTAWLKLGLSLIFINQKIAMEQYDNIAETYKLAEGAILKRYVHKPTFLKLIGDIKGKSVIDVGCGSGYSTRLLKYAGAMRILGVDISKEQIRLAMKEERNSPLGIDYIVGDVTTFDFSGLGGFDVVAAMFLLHYSETKERLFQMCRNISTSVKSGGRFVALVDIPDALFHSNQYDISCDDKGPLVEGNEIKFSYWKGGKIACTFCVYYWSKETMEAALKGAGFTDIEWHGPVVSEDGVKRFGREFWKEYIEKPFVKEFTCKKP